MTDAISPREHELTVRIAVLEEKVAAAEREKLLQAREYERRLTDLNHAHEKQVKDQQTYISEDKFNGFIGEINAWRGTIDAWKTTVVSTLSGFEGGKTGSTVLRNLVIQSITILISLSALMIVAFKK